MKKIESREQREQAIEWMVKTAQELEHPLITAEQKAKKQAVYDYVSSQVLDYNEILFAGLEYPPLEKAVEDPVPEENKTDLSSWLEDDD